jgi:polysaccharide biosynthesis protein PslG
VLAADFASSLFRIQWLQGEGSVPNFWGPSATEGMLEPYAESPGGQRLVQYFDKGRMELTDPASGAVTNGLLAKELVTGDQQIGNTATTHHDPPAIPVAGDPGGAGPTYATLNTVGAPLFAPTPNRGNMALTASFSDDGRLVVTSGPTTGITPVRTYDAATQHNVLAPFVDFRNRVGLSAIGYAICEPFRATFMIGGVPKSVVVQVFERRVLTYTESNPDPFKTEFGNIGRHYYMWRYH